eukprot:Opistho-2@58617
MPMTHTMLRWWAAGCLALLGSVAVAQGAPVAEAASTTPAAQAAPAASAAALALPDANETNAQRAKSQPYNNAPFWRAVRESGQQSGISNLPGAEKGVLIQQFVQYPGSRFTTAGEAWREVRNRWIIPYGGALLLIVVVAIGLFFMAKPMYSALI